LKWWRGRGELQLWKWIMNAKWRVGVMKIKSCVWGGMIPCHLVLWSLGHRICRQWALPKYRWLFTNRAGPEDLKLLRMNASAIAGTRNSFGTDRHWAWRPCWEENASVGPEDACWFLDRGVEVAVSALATCTMDTALITTVRSLQFLLSRFVYLCCLPEPCIFG
jgi:hypothetical protein